MPMAPLRFLRRPMRLFKNY
ncbi:UNVERIFIED_CONTAM: hypothetical protein GTU68_058050 [Idotea baltica]|nr:hypothetical protein [Idotea baltica]